MNVAAKQLCIQIWTTRRYLLIAYGYIMFLSCVWRLSTICSKHANKQRFHFHFWLNQVIALNTRDKIFAVAILQYWQSPTTTATTTKNTFYFILVRTLVLCFVKCVKFNTTRGFSLSSLSLISRIMRSTNCELIIFFYLFIQLSNDWSESAALFLSFK